KKFNRNTEEGVKARIGLCANIAFAIHNFHSIGQYSMVDLNPNNILVTIKGKVSLIDCDSVQVKAPNGRIYHGEMAMPDYIPPESVYTRSSKNYIDHNWHRFSLAVIFYKILYGIHPYAATSSGVYAGATSLGEKIQNGLFVHGKKRKYLTSIPGPHDDFFLLPSSIRRLFIRAFETNNSILGNRPSADDWGAVLKRELDHNFQLLGESFYSRPRKVMKVERPTRSFTIDWEVTTKQSGQNTSYLFWKELFRQAAFGRALYYVDIRGQQKYKFIFLLLIWAWTVPILFWVFEAIHFFKTEYLTIGCAFLFASVYFIIAYFISLVSAVFFHFSKNHPRVKMIW
ncbi:MAG: hypothetical protein KDD02_00480, partial [Phaeodactylibacter sp.]|nr:hypothetical protein [Phaeodactylibacter sp.]